MVGFRGAGLAGEWRLSNPGIAPTATGGQQVLVLDSPAEVEARLSSSLFDVTTLSANVIRISDRSVGRGVLEMVDPDDGTMVDRISLDFEDVNDIRLGYDASPTSPVLFAEREGRVAVRLSGVSGLIVDEGLRVEAEGAELRRIAWDVWGMTPSSRESVVVRVEAGGANAEIELPVGGFHRSRRRFPRLENVHVECGSDAARLRRGVRRCAPRGVGGTARDLGTLPCAGAYGRGP
ncbi:MAG: hypothetical protein AAGF12_34095 [Myxococcota bacterium]